MERRWKFEHIEETGLPPNPIGHLPDGYTSSDPVLFYEIGLMAWMESARRCLEGAIVTVEGASQEEEEHFRDDRFAHYLSRYVRYTTPVSEALAKIDRWLETQIMSMERGDPTEIATGGMIAATREIVATSEQYDIAQFFAQWSDQLWQRVGEKLRRFRHSRRKGARGVDPNSRASPRPRRRRGVDRKANYLDDAEVVALYQIETEDAKSVHFDVDTTAIRAIEGIEPEVSDSDKKRRRLLEELRLVPELLVNAADCVYRGVVYPPAGQRLRGVKHVDGLPRSDKPPRGDTRMGIFVCARAVAVAMARDEIGTAGTFVKDIKDAVRPALRELDSETNDNKVRRYSGQVLFLLEQVTAAHGMVELSEEFARHLDMHQRTGVKKGRGGES